MRYIKISALVAVMLLILSACGQRGALYNPAAEPVKNSPTKTGSVAPEQSPLQMSSQTSEGGL